MTPATSSRRRSRRDVALAVVGSLLVGACSGSGDSDDVGLTTDTRSSSIDAEADQLEFLDRYVELASPVEETEFHIVYRDNSTGRIPGPSDWTIRYAVRIDPSDTDAWTDGWTPSEAPATWDEGLLAEWDVEAAPTFYVRSGSVRAVYGDDVVLQLSETS